MADIIIFDKSTGKVKDYLKSQHTPDFTNRDDVIVNPVIPDVDRKYWKIVDGNVVKMTQAEKDTVDAEEQAEKEALEKMQKDIDRLDRTIRALASLTFREINKLRKLANQTKYTWTQFKDAYVNIWNEVS